MSCHSNLSSAGGGIILTDVKVGPISSQAAVSQRLTPAHRVSRALEHIPVNFPATMKIFSPCLLIVSAALAVSEDHGGPPDSAKLDCLAVCQSDKGAPKSAMTLSSPLCSGITGNCCEENCNW